MTETYICLAYNLTSFPFPGPGVAYFLGNLPSKIQPLSSPSRRGNVIRQLTGAMFHPSQVEALCWRLHGKGGDSSTAYNPTYDMYAVGFAHSECEPYTQFAPCTACTVHTGCIPYADCGPLHSCVLYPVYAVYAAHATHLACAPYAACYTYASCTLYAACALYTFFQLILVIQHSKSDFSLLRVLVMSLFPYTQYCACMRLHTDMSNCFQIMPLQGKNM